MKENLSAWMDSELDARQAAALLPQLTRDSELRRDWDCYHLIGDVIRGVQGPDLCAAVSARLDMEPTILAPHRRRKAERLRWAALSLAASVAAIAFVGWVALSSGVRPQPVQIAAIPAPAPAPVVLPVAVPAGAAVNDYLFAHQRYSPSIAMQGVASYVRTVADEGSGLR